ALRRKHAESLRLQEPPAPSRALAARRHRDRARRVLFVDDRVPRATMGSGSFYPLTEPFESRPRIRAALPRDVEVMVGYGAARFAEFLAERRGYYEVLLVSP